MTPLHRPLRRAVWLVLVAVVVLRPGEAESQPQAPTGRVSLVDQTLWIDAGQPLDLRLWVTIDGPGDLLEVAVTVYPRVTSRTQFNQTVDGRLRTSGLEIKKSSLLELVPGPDGTVTFSFTPQLSREGVYPVRVELREQEGGPVLDTFTTHLVYLPAPVEGDRLKVAWVVPVHAPPATRPDGSSELDPAVADHLGGLARALEAHSDVPVVLRPTPETLDALASSPREADRATVFALARARRDHQLLADHYVATSLPGLLDAGLDREVAAQLRRGADVANRAFGAPPDSRTWVADEPVDEESVARLHDRHVDRVVVPDAALVPTDLPTTLTQPFELEARSRRLPAAAADGGLAAHGAGARDPVLAARHLLADLAVIYFDRPGRPGGVVVAPPLRSRLSPAFVEAVLDGLRASPILQGSTLDDIFEGVPPATATAGRRPLVRTLAPPPAPPPRITAGGVRAARRRLEAFATILPADAPVYDRIDRTLLTSQSSELTPRTRAAYLDGVGDQIDAELAMIQIPRDRTITLTARNGEIPVTINSRTGYPVRATLRVESDILEFPEGDAVPLDLARPNTTRVFTVRARSSGSFPLRVRLESPDGSLVLAETRFTVRSTAASGVAVAISVGAASFLLIWWARNLRGRRSRRLLPA
jgi:hypothetical protein